MNKIDPRTPRSFEPEAIAELLDMSRGYQFLKYFPGVFVEKSKLIDMGFEDADDGFYLIKCLGEYEACYAVEKYQAFGMVVVDFLLDKGEVFEGVIKSLGAIQLGGFHEFVKGNLNNPIGLDLAAVIHWG
jgi:hypothetical protein